MDLDAVLAPFEERYERIKELSDENRKRLYLMIGDVEESVGIEHIVDCLADETSMAGDGVLRCYVGFEPSGKAHIGWKVLSLQLKRMLEADANVLIFLADWHAWVNDKFGGNMEDIQKTAVYMEETFRALLDYPEEGDGPGQLRFYWASHSWILEIIGHEFFDVQREQRSRWFAKRSPSWGAMRHPQTTICRNSTILPCKQLIFSS